jgi:glyoxylase-like metal-dependent hydrolase (beta-lactamase superfamily II)
MDSHADYAVLQVTYAVRRVRTSHVWADFAELGIADEVLSMPYSFWVVRTDDGPVLIDTGFAVPEAYWVDDADWRAVPDALAAVGIRPEEVSRVILTHLHFDHAGSVDLFPSARIAVSRPEYEYWGSRSPEELQAGFIDPRHLAAVRAAEAEGRLDVWDGVAEPAPGITMIPAPGHTPGQVAVLVTTAAGAVLIASDAAHFFEQVERGWRFFAHSDAEESDRSIRMLQQRALDAGAPFIPGHDIRVSERYPPLAGPAAEFATVLL